VSGHDFSRAERRATKRRLQPLHEVPQRLKPSFIERSYPTRLKSCPDTKREFAFPMQLKQSLTSAVDRLEAADVGSPRMNAEVLLMFLLGVNRAYLYAHPERELTEEEEARYDEVLGRRSTGMPSQYITGHQEFWGLDFVVSPAVLIPRPETEHLVETVVDLARDVTHPKLVDVGTGSGCIALALAHELKDAEVYAVDLSVEALEVARANAARLQLDERVKFAQCNVLTRVGNPIVIPSQDQPSETKGVIPSEAQTGSPPSAAFALGGVLERSRGTPIAEEIFLRDLDFVVSNPPYVGFDEADKVQRSVREFEPQVAVFAGERGLDVIGPLIAQAHQALKAGGWLAMEIGYSMRDAVVHLLDDAMWEEVRTVPDLQGIPRVIAARSK
jgi:release factor glutamine methyltransferase